MSRVSEGGDLPAGWASAKVRQVGRVQLGRQRSPDVHAGKNMRPYLRVANVFEDEIRLDDVMEMHFSEAVVERFELRPGDILLNEGQSPHLLGRPAMYAGQLPGACFTNSLIRFQASGVVESGFALYLFRHWMHHGDFRALSQITTNIAHLSIGRFAEMDFPVPPLAEQRRIVAKLEDLLARSKRAKEALDAIPPLLETLRRSILAAAFRGDLTAEWREKHPDVEPADRLLARIRVERRKKWEEAELARLRAKAKAPTDDRWKEKYREPEPVDTSGLPELPEGWAWASLEELTDADRGIPYGIVLTGEETADGTPTVRCGDIKAFSIEAASLKRVSKAIVAEYQRTRLVGGEVLIAIRGTVGATAVASPEMEGMNISREVAMIPVLRGQDSRNLMFCLASPQAQSRLMKHVKGVAQSGINLSDLRTLPVPVAPMSEQQALNAAIDGALAKVAGLGRLCVQATDRETLLVASVLGAAFRGELVPQDPNDEPADVMLARLAAEQAAPASAAKPSRGKADPKTPARKTRLR